jgi:transposase
LNKGEARNALARATLFCQLGELRDRTFENQAYRASGLNLIVAAVILWNTWGIRGRSCERAVWAKIGLGRIGQEEGMEKQHFVGLDVSLRETSVCVIDAEGRTSWQGRCASDPQAIAAVLHARAPHLVRVGLESGPLSTWHWHALARMGLPVVCLDARHAKAVLSMRPNKSDANDAHGLAQIVRMGWYRQVQVKGTDAHLVRTLLGARAQLVAMQRDLSNQVRGVLKTFGLVVGAVSKGGFEARVRELVADAPALAGVVEALLALWRATGEQIAALHKRLLAYARADEDVRRLMTAPGVGAVTAVAFVAAVEDPGRFRRSTDVGAYFGLTPRRHQSGEIDRAGRISKCGDPLVRSYLFEAANAVLTRVQKWCSLRAWGLRLAKRVGANKAKVAVARKLAVVMHRMWRDNQEFRWAAEPKAAAA